MTPSKRHLFGSGSLSALIFGYALLIAYGSLYPFHNWRTPVVGLWDFLFVTLKGQLSISDIDLNILAYMPLGLLLVLRIRRNSGLLFTLVSATLLGAGLSLGMELLQNYLPERVPSRIDLATNTFGTCLGALGALLLGSNMPLGRVLKRQREALLLPGTLADIGLIVLAVGAFTLLAPLAPALEPALRSGSIVPLWQIPFGNFQAAPLAVAEYAAKVVALGLLLAAMSLDGRIRLRPYLLLLVLVMAAKFISTVLLFRVPPLQWLLSFKAILGLGIGLALLPWLQRLPRSAKAWASAGIILGLTIFDALQADPNGAPTRGNFSWIPFAAQMHGLQGLLDVLATAMPFLVAGCAINLVTPYMRRSLMLLAGLVVVLVAASGVEWLQRDLPGRTADITDVLLAGMGWVATWFWIAHIPPQKARGVAPPPHVHTTRQRSKLSWGVMVLAALGMLWGGVILLDRPIELPLSSKNTPELPNPEDLPPVDLPNFRTQHPRLPVPTPADIARLQAENPGYFQQQEWFAKRGDLYPRILLARVFPGSQDLLKLHQEVAGLDIIYRGQNAEIAALAYDWLYDQWTEPQRIALRDKVAEGAFRIIGLIQADRLSPYNVYLYNSPFQRLMIASIALHQDDPRGELAMRFTSDMWKNRMLPVWRQIMGKNGGWHEGGEYIALSIGQAVYQLPALWRHATGEDYFKTEPGIRGFMDFILYRLRPDGTHFRLGDANFGERIAPDLTPLALEFRDAAAFSVQQRPPRPAPSSWPWGPLTEPTLYDAEAVKQRPLTKLMDGIGIVVARSSWEPDATYVTFKAGDNFWSHSHLDQGSFTIFKGGPLAIDSGLYGAGYGSDHHMNYNYQTIAHNTITVTDPDDTVPLRIKAGQRFIANDGGQRRIGSGWGIEPAPMNLAEWNAKRDIYHTGKIEEFTERDGVTIAVADLTPAYTNRYSGQGTFSHRTRRVEMFRRTLVYDRSSDMLVIFDRVIATKASFRKRWLLHTLEQPQIVPGGFVVRTSPNAELRRAGGTLRGLVLLPEQAQIAAVGGKGAEFLVDGRNYDEGGKIAQTIRGKNDPDTGSWRLEISPAAGAREDTFLTILAPSLGANADIPKARLLRNGDQVGCELISSHRPPIQLWFNGNHVEMKSSSPRP